MKKDKDAKNHILWCCKQRQGIKLEDPNNNLCKVYLKKAKSSLNMLESALEKEEVEWICTTAYYARYFALYALLQKCGIKSEIHDCTLSIMQFLFVKEEILTPQLYKELQIAKELRVDTQYYATEDLDITVLKKDAIAAQTFVLEMEEVIENLTQERIALLREKLRAV